MISAEDLDLVASLARRRAGLLLRGESAFFVENRLRALVRREGAGSVAGLVQMLRDRGDPELADATVEALAAPETSFFRDRTLFDRLRDDVLPALAERRGGEPVRVWCAGCSTGQEAYSLRMLAEEHAERVGPLALDILGTDLSEKALEKARAGAYNQFEVQRGLPIRLLLRHFTREGEAWMVSPDLRRSVRWTRRNLLEDVAPLGQFDLVLCRNVLSYLDVGPRRSVLANLAAATAEGGYLALGLEEAIEPPTAFEPVAAGVALYRRKAGDA